MAQQYLHHLVKTLCGKAIPNGDTLTIKIEKERHTFQRYELGNDTLIIEQGILRGHTDLRRSMTYMPKRKVHGGRKGLIITITLGDFSTIIGLLLHAKIYKLSYLPKKLHSSVVRESIVLIGIEDDGFRIFQRETDFPLLIQADTWLQQHGVPLNHILFPENTTESKRYCEVLGQMWRLIPPAYTDEEIKNVLDQALQYGECDCQYYTSHRGVLYLTYWAFMYVGALADTDFKAFRQCLKEWVTLQNGAILSNMRSWKNKKNNKRMVELFGLSHEQADRFIIPSLERLMEYITLGKMTPKDASLTFQGIGLLFKQLLNNPYEAHKDQLETINALYRLIMDELDTENRNHLHFNQRRIALPGATFLEGEIKWHPGIDEQTKGCINYLLDRLNHDEKMSFINVYTVRSSKSLNSDGASREIVYKTNTMPLPISLIEKELVSRRQKYGSYMLARAKAFKTLGIAYPDFQLVAHTGAYGRKGKEESETNENVNVSDVNEKDANDNKKRKKAEYFLRTRCQGEPLTSIHESFFRSIPSTAPRSLLQEEELPEDQGIVLALAKLYGQAAGMNLIVKKFIPEGRTCKYGQGKEIFAFEYDTVHQRERPVSVQVCSVRGTMGWPDSSQTQRNLNKVYFFYFPVYAEKLCDYWLQHRRTCSLNSLATAFFDGIEEEVLARYWHYQQKRDDFDSHNPEIPVAYQFPEKWRFALWTLECHARDIDGLRKNFMDYVRKRLTKIKALGVLLRLSCVLTAPPCRIKKEDR